MTFTKQRMILIGLIVLALVLGLIGWTIVHAAMVPALHHTTIHHSLHQLAWYCPAPPYVC